MTAGRERTSESRPAGLTRRPQLSDEVAGHIRGLIMSGTLRPGRFVRMDEQAAELGVSVTPVREALVSLRGEGLVEQVPHRGYRVADLQRQDIVDIFWLQGTIAGRLARRAAEVITPLQIDELRTLNLHLRHAVDAHEPEAVESCEFAFHRFVNRVAGGTKLAWLLFGAIRYTPARLYASDPQWGASAVASHDHLIDAMARRNADEVVEVVRRQFFDGADTLIDHLERVGLWAERV